MRHETEASWNVYDAEEERQHGPSNDCEVYFLEGSDTDEIALLTSEREDFESNLKFKITSDVIAKPIFDLLLGWLIVNELLHEDGKERDERDQAN